MTSWMIAAAGAALAIGMVLLARSLLVRVVRSEIDRRERLWMRRLAETVIDRDEPQVTAQRASATTLLRLFRRLGCRSLAVADSVRDGDGAWAVLLVAIRSWRHYAARRGRLDRGMVLGERLMWVGALTGCTGAVAALQSGFEAGRGDLATAPFVLIVGWCLVSSKHRRALLGLGLLGLTIALPTFEFAPASYELPIRFTEFMTVLQSVGAIGGALAAALLHERERVGLRVASLATSSFAIQCLVLAVWSGAPAMTRLCLVLLSFAELSAASACVGEAAAYRRF